MKVSIIKENKVVEEKAKTVEELLEKLNINHTTVLVVRNKTLLTQKAELSDDDKIELLPVISGG